MLVQGCYRQKQLSLSVCQGSRFANVNWWSVAFVRSRGKLETFKEETLECSAARSSFAAPEEEKALQVEGSEHYADEVGAKFKIYRGKFKEAIEQTVGADATVKDAVLQVKA